MSRISLSGEHRRPLVLWVFLLVVLALLGVTLIVAHGLSTPALTLDAYFYLAKAENLIEGRGLTTYWNDGIDRKFFPMHSILLAPFALLRPVLDAYWVPAEVLYYLLTGLVLGFLVWRIEPSPVVRFAALAFWLLNPNVLLWHSVPYSEGLATFFLWSAVLLCYPGWRQVSERRFYAAALMAGLALISRAESVLIAPWFVGLLTLTLVRQGASSIPWRRLPTAIILFATPMVLWWVSLPASSEPARLLYVTEFLDRFSWDQLSYNFQVLFYSVLFENNIEAPWRWMAILQSSTMRLYLLFLGLGISGGLSPRARWVALTILAYQGLHAFWHYSYGRFNLIILPLVAYLMALGVVWTFRKTPRLLVVAALVFATDLLSYFGDIGLRLRPFLLLGLGIAFGLWEIWRTRRNSSHAAENSERSTLFPSALAPVLTLAIAGTMIVMGHSAIMRQKHYLNSDPRIVRDRSEEISALISRISPSDTALTYTDVVLAYEVGALTGQRLWFSEALPDFIPAAFEPESTLAFLADKQVAVVLSRRNVRRWIRDHSIPDEYMTRFNVARRWNGSLLMEYDPSILQAKSDTPQPLDEKLPPLMLPGGG